MQHFLGGGGVVNSLVKPLEFVSQEVIFTVFQSKLVLVLPFVVVLTLRQSQKLECD